MPAAAVADEPHVETVEITERGTPSAAGIDLAGFRAALQKSVVPPVEEPVLDDTQPPPPVAAEPVVIPEIKTPPADDGISVTQIMLDRAALYGVSKEKAEELGPKVLEATLDAIASVFTKEQPHIAAPAVQAQPVPVPAASTTPPLPQEISDVLDWTPEETQEIEAFGLPKPVLERVKKVGALEKKMAEVDKQLKIVTAIRAKVEQRENMAVVAELDAAIAALPLGAETVYGKGKTMRLAEGSPQFKARQNLMTAVRTMENNFAKQGRFFDEPVLELAAEADRIVRPDAAKAQAKAEFDAKQKRAMSMTANRPAAAGTRSAPMTHAQYQAGFSAALNKSKN